MQSSIALSEVLELEPSALKLEVCPALCRDLRDFAGEGHVIDIIFCLDVVICGAEDGPKEPFEGMLLAHFAVDPELVRIPAAFDRPSFQSAFQESTVRVFPFCDHLVHFLSPCVVISEPNTL